jgi:hypothetical protein
MKLRNILIAAILILLATAAMYGCKEKPAEDYYPLGVGSFWEYNVTTFLKDDITKIGKEIVKVVGKDRVDTTECYVVDRYTIEGNVPSMSQYREFLAKTEEGIFCTKRSFPLLSRIKSIFPGLQSDIRHSDNETRFKNKLKDGDTWKWDGIVNLELIQEDVKRDGSNPAKAPEKPPEVRQVKGTMEYKYSGRETIRVMNKDMDCIKISLFGKSEAGQEIESVIWFAPGIGRVREEQKFFQGSDSVLYLFELCNYNITNRESFKAK